MTNSPKLTQVVATFEVDPIGVDDDVYGALKFRIEVLMDHEANNYFPRIYRWETFRVQPTFSLHEGQPNSDLADHEILVKDMGIDCSGIVGSSIKEVLDKVQQQVRETLFVPVN